MASTIGVFCLDDSKPLCSRLVLESRSSPRLTEDARVCGLAKASRTLSTEVELKKRSCHVLGVGVGGLGFRV